MEKVRTLLTRWREKVYALLVQLKQQEIEDVRSKRQSQMKVYNMYVLVCISPVVHYQESSLLELAEKAERDHKMLAHALADRGAELQLQQAKTEVSEPFRRSGSHT